MGCIMSSLGRAAGRPRRPNPETTRAVEMARLRRLRTEQYFSKMDGHRENLASAYISPETSKWTESTAGYFIINQSVTSLDQTISRDSNSSVDDTGSFEEPRSLGFWGWSSHSNSNRTLGDSTPLEAIEEEPPSLVPEQPLHQPSESSKSNCAGRPRAGKIPRRTSSLRSSYAVATGSQVDYQVYAAA